MFSRICICITHSYSVNFFATLAALKAVNIKELASLRTSKRLQDVLDQIEKYQLQRNSNNQHNDSSDAEIEYLLIVEANNLAVDIDGEICKYYNALNYLNIFIKISKY